MRKPGFCENKGADQLQGNHAADQRLCLVQSLYFLNPKFQASSHLLWLYSLVSVGPEDKFSCNRAQIDCTYEPSRVKTGFLHMRKQRRRSALR